MSEKVGRIVESATEAVKMVVTKKRFHAKKKSTAPPPSPTPGGESNRQAAGR